ncbi:MAG: F420-0--gamma-glutamyl ligase [Clostridiaceae bacterium]|jgi:F420-0:gamma-glutamyl ligase|nr:F420-0--gamma-glutamyl ligase [Clostridiaceae bacterium]
MIAHRFIGTSAFGIRAPIVREGDDLVQVVVSSVIEAQQQNEFQLRDHDVIGVTESLLARAQGNYASLEAVATDAARQLPGDFVVLFPILSRNRFSLILKGLALTGKKITVMLSYPSDEVGNQLMDVDQLMNSGLNPHHDVLTEEQFRSLFGHGFKHPFTGLDYLDLYKTCGTNNNITIALANDCRAALQFSKHVLIANIHDRHRIKRQLIQAGAETAIGLDDLLNEPVNGSGHNPDYGLLGSNQAGESRLKLFPRDCKSFVTRVQAELKEKTGRQIEVMIYGDGAFKDPQGKIWELADPVVSPGYTPGLDGLPNEIKMKYLVDNELADLTSDQAAQAVRQRIKAKDGNLVGQADSLGTTPRKMTDLLGSLCDLISGSGDKGTPIVLIQGYFDNYASE